MVPEFEEAAYALQNNGDVSAPVLTAYGWHIIKRVDLRSIPAFEQARADLESRIARDSRANINKANLLAKLKKEYKFTENAKARSAVFATIVDTTYRNGNWQPTEFKKNEVVVSFADRKYTQSDLAAYLKTQSGLLMSADLAIFLNNTYQKWVDDQLLAYEDSRLEDKHADFRALMKEYREGILLFDLTDQMVWSKAVTDTDGLSSFYASQGDKYMYKERVDADVYTLSDAKSAKSLRKEIGKKKNTHEKLLAKYNKTNPLGLKISSGKFEKGALPVLDKVEWKAGTSDVIENNGQFVVVRIKEVLPPSVKPLNEVRGLVTSDYQQFLERNWISELENKYQVVINRETFNSILPQ
jgi:peptidyl-prolyl cis-trans isomerase SurA